MAMGGWPPLVSASLALAACCLVLVHLGCPHAPACPSALIVALDAASNLSALLGMAIGVATLIAQAILISRVVGVNVPLWPRAQRRWDRPCDNLPECGCVWSDKYGRRIGESISSTKGRPGITKIRSWNDPCFIFRSALQPCIQQVYNYRHAFRSRLPPARVIMGGTGFRFS